ncbi:DMT family transporter [Poseidonibacter lekithochrous]|uniref:DMT family transporter n=1 Tax=Poseidonibacter lekithochrous TaxID=1904463 RepID=UPI000D3B4592|nr:DMT family transporter [Poseidonibacter lekithochrous]
MNIHQKENINLFFLISVSLLFLSLNSIFCKAALVNNYIDAYSFTFFRLLSASAMLVIIYLFKNKKISISFKQNWISSFMLFLYAVSFSYSYLSIDAGFGTLLLFAVVQIVMLASSFFYKESLSKTKILGLLIAFSSLIYLLYPSESFELSYFHIFLMIISGIAWAVYSILGKNSSDALFNTMDNFIKASFFIILFFFIFIREEMYFTFEGLIFAILSGSITSALGYVLWYQVLPQIQIVTAGIIQLFVPILAIIVSIIFLDELLTMSLFISTALVSFGVVLSLYSKKKINQNT